jgi:hypothetical protein
MRYKIQFRSIYGSGLIPLILSQNQLTNNSTHVFELGDVRSSWDIPNMLLTLSNDKSRVNAAADILATKDPNIVAISLFKLLEKEHHLILGPLSSRELNNTIQAYHSVDYLPEDTKLKLKDLLAGSLKSYG